MLVHAFVTSRLDTCNALLCGLPELEIKKLQRIQNIAARIVVRARSHEHNNTHSLTSALAANPPAYSLQGLAPGVQSPEWWTCSLIPI